MFNSLDRKKLKLTTQSEKQTNVEFFYPKAEITSFLSINKNLKMFSLQIKKIFGRTKEKTKISLKCHTKFKLQKTANLKKRYKKQKNKLQLNQHTTTMSKCRKENPKYYFNPHEYNAEAETVDCTIEFDLVTYSFTINITLYLFCFVIVFSYDFCFYLYFYYYFTLIIVFLSYFSFYNKYFDSLQVYALPQCC